MSGISIAQAVAIALLYWVINNYWFSFWNFQNLQWPVVHGLLIGLIMGDPIKGTILGATIQPPAWIPKPSSHLRFPSRSSAPSCSPCRRPSMLPA